MLQYVIGILAPFFFCLWGNAMLKQRTYQDEFTVKGKNAIKRGKFAMKSKYATKR